METNPSKKDQLLTYDEIFMADVLKGKVLVTECIPEDFYKKSVESFCSYLRLNGEPMTLEETVDTSMRVVLIPHHRKIDDLQSKCDQLEKLAREVLEEAYCTFDKDSPDIGVSTHASCCVKCGRLEKINSILKGEA